ncbi:MAG TPA: hypothetical protein VLG71_02230, partial [Candidatus Limnocylindria bacterium]|nr:hypothetical protein [Candidatus Limnocylindria bacterium]
MQLSYLRVLILGLGLISTTPTTPVSLSQVVTINNCIHGVGAVGAGLFSCMQVYSGIKCRCAHRGARLMHIAAFSVS